VRESNIAVEFPKEAELVNRMNAVLQMIYLLFNEGYNSSQSDALIRRDITDEAQRLCHLLTEHPLCNVPEANALMALMLFQASRFQARLKESGELVILSKQNPDDWNAEYIADGARYLAASASGVAVSRYHIEAGIAAHYALAPSFEDIAWGEIEKLYRVLLTLTPSSIARLNFVIVRSYLYGATAALVELADLESILGKHYLFHATRGELLKRTGDTASAREAYQIAKKLTQSAMEKAFLEKQ
jgi:predicted RNA polymerase sigma factor